MFNNLILTLLNIIVLLILYFINITILQCESTDLVVWGNNLTSNVGFPKFTKIVSYMIQLTPFTKAVIIGLILGDGWLNIPNKHSKNARLGFKQGTIHFSYFWFVFNLLSHYCKTIPYLASSFRNGT